MEKVNSIIKGIKKVLILSFIFFLFLDWNGAVTTTVVNVVSPTKHVSTVKHPRGQSTITTELVNGKKVQVIFLRYVLLI